MRATVIQMNFRKSASTRQKLLKPCLNGLPIRCISSIYSPKTKKRLHVAHYIQKQCYGVM
ncbi:hypothetical protein L9F63_017144, partial [Diploptera punctata]